ncbi:MAG: hypothetical protein AAF609_26570 [Cyanobacteria bacterium P01_C01_bin.120]
MGSCNHEIEDFYQMTAAIATPHATPLPFLTWAGGKISELVITSYPVLLV